MSGALDSVFGKGGILGAAFNIASTFFPPLAIANSLSNLLVEAVGSAVKTAVDTLMNESGMPKFIRDIVNDVVDQVLPGQRKETDPAVDSFIGSNDNVKNWMDNFVSDLSNQIVENTRKALGQEGEAEGKKHSAGSWLQAIALAMGEVMGDKAAKLVELSHTMSDLNGTGKGITEDIKNADGETKEDLRAEQAQNARDFSETQAMFQATSQEFNMLSNTFSNAIKAIGEGLTTMGRKG